MKNLEIMGVQEMDAMEMKSVDGGEPVSLLVLASAGAIVGLALGWIALCDEAHKKSKEIGATLAK
ncbi:MAG: hypothetical protein JXR50_02855 [Prolixibacteraceae bacterium]|nr:hypothetical protein [Prolixibacteraceae bacterium]